MENELRDHQNSIQETGLRNVRNASIDNDAGVQDLVVLPRGILTREDFTQRREVQQVTLGCPEYSSKPAKQHQTEDLDKTQAGVRIEAQPPEYHAGQSRAAEANDPTPETLAAYRKAYGPDYYSFREGSLYGIVLDSSLFKAPAKVTAEAAKQELWLEVELKKAQVAGAIPVVFQHISFFLEKADEPDQYFNIPMETRRRVLALLKRYGVHYVFAGHYHRNSFGKDGELEMVTSGPAGKSLGPEGSGIRLGELKGTVVNHAYYSLGAIPNEYPIPPVKP